MRLNTSVSTTVQSFALCFPTLGQYNAWSCFAGRACTGCWLTHILTSWAGKVGSHNGLCGWRYENILIQHHQYIVKISESCWAEGLSWIALKHDKAPPTGVQCARERDEVPLRWGKQDAMPQAALYAGNSLGTVSPQRLHNILCWCPFFLFYLNPPQSKTQHFNYSALKGAG